MVVGLDLLSRQAPLHPQESTMASTTGMAEPNASIGEARTHFVLLTTLLWLIDPVRGEPTVHSLDRHPLDDSFKHDNLQKKFLDSFALICSTSKKGGKTAAAVCLEQGHPSGAILRVARNLGMSNNCKSRLQQVLEALRGIAQRGDNTDGALNKILLKVIDLGMEKIRDLLQKLRKEDIWNVVDEAIRKTKLPLSLNGDKAFVSWIQNRPKLTSLSSKATPTELMPHIKWACEARWTYSEQFESLLKSDGGQVPKWTGILYKLGRYFAAAKSMIKFATKHPDLFLSIRIETIEPPAQISFSLGEHETTALASVLKRLNKEPEEMMARLGQTWTQTQTRTQSWTQIDPEKHFRDKCQHNLTVHAESQLLSFYDHHPELTPPLLFMGTSKKACFLCHTFMSRHPLKMTVSACHQKLYPSWTPAPWSDSTVRKKQKTLLWELTVQLERTTARDLDTRLGRRRLANMDSTAGPSLTTTSYVVLPQDQGGEDSGDEGGGASLSPRRQRIPPFLLSRRRRAD